jgi:hypothetical protein
VPIYNVGPLTMKAGVRRGQQALCRVEYGPFPLNSHEFARARPPLSCGLGRMSGIVRGSRERKRTRRGDK